MHPSDRHLDEEDLSRFATGDLSPREREAAEAHLAGCDDCLEELADQVRLATQYAIAPITAEEQAVLAQITEDTVGAQTERILRLLPRKPTVVTRPLPQLILEWIDDVVRLPALVPALTMAVIIGLGAVGGYRLFNNYQATRFTEQGYESMRRDNRITADDYRPPGGFEKSIFSSTHSTSPAGEGSEASSKFERALSYNAGNREALLGVATNYFFEGQIFLADSLARLLISRDSSDAGAWTLHGLVSQRSGDTEAALQAFLTAITQKPGFAEAYFNRARLFAETGQNDEARKAWSEYLEIDPNSEWAEVARQWLSEH